MFPGLFGLGDIMKIIAYLVLGAIATLFAAHSAVAFDRSVHRMDDCINLQPPRLSVFQSEEEPFLFGYRNAENKVIIVPKFTLAMEFGKHGYAYADGNYIDTEGTIYLSPFVFDNGPDYHRGGRARFVENGKIGFVDHCLTKVISAQFDFAFPFSKGSSIICNGCVERQDRDHPYISGGLWGVIDQYGKIMVPIEYADKSLVALALKKIR